MEPHAIVLIEPYRAEDLKFAYNYHLYLRWRTHRVKSIAALRDLDRSVWASLVADYGIHILECASNPTDVLVQASLRPEESVSSCASKLKGRASRWLRGQLRLDQPLDLLSKGYFACTTGKSTAETINSYLSSQSEHHGYDKRLLPPVYVQRYTPAEVELGWIKSPHSFVNAQFHLVFATLMRRGVFGSEPGKRVADEWLKLQRHLRAALIKVSFVPDHVHVAVRVHPSVSPANFAVSLMNSAQQVMQRELVRVGLDRLWQPSAYIGSFGDLASPQIRKYIENWEKSQVG